MAENEIETINDMNNVRPGYVFRPFPRAVHKWAGAYKDGHPKPNQHKDVEDEAALEAALAQGWSKEPVLEDPKPDAGKGAKARRPAIGDEAEPDAEQAEAQQPEPEPEPAAAAKPAKAAKPRKR